MSWNEARVEPREVPWRRFALEVFVVLVIVGFGCLVSALT
jgi:hypothetical protein